MIKQKNTPDLFSSEHGPSGEFGLRGRDEINMIQKGGNFGWPAVVGAAGKNPYHDPVLSGSRQPLTHSVGGRDVVRKSDRKLRK